MFHIAPFIEGQTDKFNPVRLTFCGASTNGLTDYVYPALVGDYVNEVKVCPKCLESPDYALYLLSIDDLEHQHEMEQYAQLLDLTEHFFERFGKK